jgi:pimeloyl-ACP methyl ester carboxylesterase
VEELLAVMDAVGSERAAVMGVFDGGPMTALFAATKPERTTALILANTSAKFVLSDGCRQAWMTSFSRSSW